MPQGGFVAEPNRPVPAHRTQIERILTRRTETAARQEAEAEALLCAHRLRIERTAAYFRQCVHPVLHETAAVLRERGLSAEAGSVGPVGEPPRLALRVAEPNTNGHGPPKLLEGCLTLSATADLERVSAHEETWRWRRGGARRDAGTILLADLGTAWVETCVLAFLNHLFLNDEAQ